MLQRVVATPACHGGEPCEARVDLCDQDRPPAHVTGRDGEIGTPCLDPVFRVLPGPLGLVRDLGQRVNVRILGRSNPQYDMNS